jgi:hypothetical protein
VSSQNPPARPRARLGLWLAAIYFILAAALFLVTALNTKPGNVGLDWVPFMVLTAPWSGMSPILAIPGVFLNALALWVVGTVAEKIIRS